MNGSPEDGPCRSLGSRDREPEIAIGGGEAATVNQRSRSEEERRRGGDGEPEIAIGGNGGWGRRRRGREETVGEWSGDGGKVRALGGGRRGEVRGAMRRRSGGDPGVFGEARVGVGRRHGWTIVGGIFGF
ncbi:hypothetical protein U1Q18_024631 [Sarracenia purpurea var. burkii]